MVGGRNVHEGAFAEAPGGLAQELIAAVEARLMWNRFGL